MRICLCEGVLDYVKYSHPWPQSISLVLCYMSYILLTYFRYAIFFHILYIYIYILVTSMIRGPMVSYHIILEWCISGISTFIYIIRWKFNLPLRMTYIQDLKEILKAKLYKNNGCPVSAASCECSRRGLRVWGWLCEDFSSIVRISHVFLIRYYIVYSRYAILSWCD